MKVKLNDGYEINVNEAGVNDWRFVKMLRKIDKGDTGLIVDVAEVLLGGEEEADRLADHLEVDGHTPPEVMVNALTEIIEKVNELKNS